VLEIWTDRTITPLDAMKKAAQTLVDHFFLFTAPGLHPQEDGAATSVAQSIPADAYNMPVERLDLSSRTLNCLKRASIHKVGEVLERTREELLKIRNFGEKSLEELMVRLQAKDLPVPAGAPEEEAVVEETPEELPEAGKEE
jgi:DNA-directed RNA polymerase subunit alpha